MPPGEHPFVQKNLAPDTGGTGGNGSSEQPKPIDVIVPMDTWKVVDDQASSIAAVGAAPCVAPVFFDPIRGKAMAGHFTDIRLDEREDGASMFDEIPNEFEDVSRLEVYLGGNSPATASLPPDIAQDMIDAAEEQKRLTIDRLHQAGIQDSQIHQMWLGPNQNTNFGIDTRPGLTPEERIINQVEENKPLGPTP